MDPKFVADYATHFDVAWKIAVQAALAVAFTGAFWGLLWLGAGLFKLINIEFFIDLLQERWFAIPATTLAVSAAIHVTDVRADIVRGIRTLGLSLLSWLLPLMTLIAAGFLATLVFTGVQPLWDTQFATALLLIAFGALVVLLNAAYQDGHDERATPRVLRYPGSFAALALVPLAALAGYALFLRIEQYGWTADRIYASACALVAAFYAAGYALSRPSGAILAQANRAVEFLRIAVGPCRAARVVHADRRPLPHFGCEPSGEVGERSGDARAIRFCEPALGRRPVRSGGPRTAQGNDRRPASGLRARRRIARARCDQPYSVAFQIPRSSEPMSPRIRPVRHCRRHFCSGLECFGHARSIHLTRRGVFRGRKTRCAMPGCSILIADGVERGPALGGRRRSYVFSAQGSDDMGAASAAGVCRRLSTSEG